MANIWFNPAVGLEDLAGLGRGTMGEFLGIQFTRLTGDALTATMPVDERTRQPYGLLHGGASCVLAETIGSVASSLVIDPSKHLVVGLEINANHLRGVRSGVVTGTATAIHLGRTTHVWDVRIMDEAGKLICVSRLTVAVIEQRAAPSTEPRR